MRTLLLVSFLLISLIGLSQPKYPIQTMFKGDSVVILSIKQSFDINKAIETQKRVIREQSRKITSLNKTIDSLNRIIDNIPAMLDSIRYVADTAYKWADELNMTLWEYANYGSFIYTMVPYNKLYFVNLDDYNLYTHDYGNIIVFEKMTKSEYEQYKELRGDYVISPAKNYFHNLQFLDFNGITRRYESWIWKSNSLLKEKSKKK